VLVGDSAAGRSGLPVNKAEVSFRRRIRSFVRRQGRMTEPQRQMLQQLWGRYGVDEGPGLLDLDRLFGRRAARIVEIGFGMGGSLAQMAQQQPQCDYLGIEVHRPGIASLFRLLDQAAITNVRVISADAVEVLENRLPAASLDGIYLFFPDPWPKKRHHKRRIVQPDFMDLVASRLRPGAVFHMATDWEDYALQAMAVISACSGLRNCFGPSRFAPRLPERPLTKFERRGQRLGHGVWDLQFQRCD